MSTFRFPPFTGAPDRTGGLGEGHGAPLGVR